MDYRWDYRCSSVIEHLSNMLKALHQSPALKERKKARYDGKPSVVPAYRHVEAGGLQVYG
jgi:hypothetical protein